ncbi:dihydrofolate reductase family protein [Chryseolinea lacunae]|uniref:Dihydrofolate reductase family protein n=1 Tax=Chryseolinea lacunae TaxID=2801331 RepID=A0ABS1KP33_9BACT|nr:dihydrofolate reductase family protein [Chryseolinea lacunae]MBL0741204.1 dihydrofolate reductase family protein [Chryseolinea lacunae]
MRKLKLQIQTSIDGYIASVDGNGNWMIWNWGPEWTWDEALQTYFKQLHATIDTVLLSKNMAEEGFINHWGAVAERADDPQYGFAKNITDASKVVFTKTLKKAPWPNAVLAKGDLAQEVNKLKQQPGKDLIAYGGASFVSSLIKANLVDEYYLFVNPIALGKGLPIFAERRPLRLLSSQGFSCGVSVLQYAR